MIKHLRLLILWLLELLHFAELRGYDRRDGRPFLVIGHRGSPCKAAENTMSSFEIAVRDDGANALEMDLCMTADGEVVLWHDWDPESLIARLRENGLEEDVRFEPWHAEDPAMRKPVDQLTLEELRTNYGYIDRRSERRRAGVEIPTFEDFVRWAASLKNGTLQRVFLDIKIPPDRPHLIPRFAEYINDVVRRYNFATPIVLESDHEEVILELLRRIPGSDGSIDVEPQPGVILDVQPFSSVERAIRHDLRFASVARPRPVVVAPWSTFRRILGYEVRRRAEHNRYHPEHPVEAITCYTINDRREMKSVISLGVDGVVTDRPALLRVVAAELGKTFD